MNSSQQFVSSVLGTTSKLDSVGESVLKPSGQVWGGETADRTVEQTTEGVPDNDGTSTTTRTLRKSYQLPPAKDVSVEGGNVAMHPRHQNDSNEKVAQLFISKNVSEVFPNAPAMLICGTESSVSPSYTKKNLTGQSSQIFGSSLIREVRVRVRVVGEHRWRRGRALRLEFNLNVGVSTQALPDENTVTFAHSTF
jgi:hypothetical protein